MRLLVGKAYSMLVTVLEGASGVELVLRRLDADESEEGAGSDADAEEKPALLAVPAERVSPAKGVSETGSKELEEVPPP